MRISIFSFKPYERPFLDEANGAAGHELHSLDARQSTATAALAHGSPAVSIFVGDDASGPVLRALHAGGTRIPALRSAGFNHVDLEKADRLGLVVARVPAYSPYAVAEHAVGLMLTLNRKFHRAPTKGSSPVRRARRSHGRPSTTSPDSPATAPKACPRQTGCRRAS